MSEGIIHAEDVAAWIYPIQLQQDKTRDGV